MSSNNRSARIEDCEALQELIPDYAFGLTAPEETRLVARKLADCPDAADQLAEFQLIQAEMRAGVTEIEPPADFEARLLAAAHSSRAEQPPTVPTSRSGPAKKVRPFTLNRYTLLAAAALLALLATNLYWVVRVNDLTQQQNQLVAQFNAVQNNNAFVLTGTSGLRWVRLPPSQQNGSAAAFLMWNAESKIGLLYAHDFPELAIGKTYQLWLTRGDEKVNAGTFRVDAEGKGALLLHIDEPIDKYTWARITAEPGNGSTAPGSDVVVVGKLAT